MSMLSRVQLPMIAPPRQLRWGTKAYDLMAAIPLVVWYGLTVIGQSRILHRDILRLDFARPDVPLALAILSKLAALLFAVTVIGLLFARRPPKAASGGVAPRVAAILGTYLSVGLLMLPRPAIPESALALSTGLVFAGMVFGIYALIWLGSSISMMAEARKLVTSGPYSVIRHPLYLAEEIAGFGVLLQFLSPWAVLIAALQFCCQLYRMHCEEAVLERAFPEYGPYKARTARLIPGVY